MARFSPFPLPLLLLLPIFLLPSLVSADDAISRMSIFRQMHRWDNNEEARPQFEGNTTTKCATDEYFDQKLDHFNASDGATYKQRYQANFQFHVNATNRPHSLPVVFLMIGGEGPIHWKWICDEQVTMMQLAKEHGAIVVQLEHRFFGQNSSAGLGDLATVNLQRLLTLDQALADIASFVPFFNQQNGLKNAKWVAFGGSYPGSMAAWLRVKYPELTVGSVASSAPIWPKVDFWEYSARMEEAIKQTSGVCYKNVKAAFSQLAEMIHSDKGKRELSEKYNAQPKFEDLAPIDLTNFMSAVFGAWQGIVQYTYDQPYHTLDNLTSVCELMADEKELQKGLFDVFWRVKKAECEKAGIKPEECAKNNFKYEEAIKPLRDESIAGENAAARAWMWMTCNEFGWYQTTDKENGIFGDILSMNFFYQQCADLFGPEIGAEYVDASVAKSLGKWGDGCTFEATNVILPNGRFDPWSRLGIRENCRDGRRKAEDADKHLLSVWTEGAAHCADMYERYEAEPAGLELTRQKIRDEVKYYLAEAGNGGGGNGAPSGTILSSSLLILLLLLLLLSVALLN